MGPTEGQLTTPLVRSHTLRDGPHPHLDAGADHARTPVADSTGRLRMDLPGYKRTGLESGAHTQGQVSAKAAGSRPDIHIRPSVHWCCICCNGPQHIHSWDQRLHGGWGRPLKPGGPDFLYHRRIVHRIRLAPKGYIEDNRVLGGRSMAGYTQA